MRSDRRAFLLVMLSAFGAMETELPAPDYSRAAASTEIVDARWSPAIQPDGYGTAVLTLSTNLSRPSMKAGTYLGA